MKLRGVLQASCCLKRSDCCLPPTLVYFLEDSRRFYELLSPVMLLLSLTVLQLDAPNGARTERKPKSFKTRAPRFREPSPGAIFAHGKDAPNGAHTERKPKSFKTRVPRLRQPRTDGQLTASLDISQWHPYGGQHAETPLHPLL
ncbi:hypothetical protein LAZ67_X002227 [Cordylochernes scorpioides]|uniref:Uncharacterized protein n=1 Tax=Cordylochernes scorpioides TaxID=51811 RepID=A0ABY6LVT9_9ARAC|nr:hypothetical protein LAZ67_X002227 [Cordylochernes scorpioides]